MKSRTRTLLVLAILCGLLGWWLGREMQPAAPAEKTAALPAPSPRHRPLPSKRPVVPLMQEAAADQFPDGTTIEVFAASHPDQIILRFPSDETYISFITAVRASNVRLIGRLDRLRAMRLSFDHFTDLDALLNDENVTHYTSLPHFPEPPAAAMVQKGLLGFADQAPFWLGANVDRSRWGSGVRIAVVDSGVVEHPGLPKISEFIDVTSESGNPVPPSNHGTAVASIISGTNPQAPGIAPAATLISIRVIDSTLRADAFSVAAGLLAAVDHQAHLMNLSLGSNEDNPLIREAVQFAQQNGLLIIAASGNSARSQAAYPAAYPGVISVGAVDGRGTQVEFSNYADSLSITAPGYAVNAAAPGGTYIRMSGTSASAPFVTGAIAATMSTSLTTLTPQQAADIVMSHTNEAGIPGPDSQYGFGILNIGRIMNRNVPGLVDVALTHQEYSAATSQLSVTFQNRGTKPLVNVLLEATAPGGTNRLNINSIAPGAVQTVSLPIAPGYQSPFAVTTTLLTGANGPDLKPADNQLSASYALR